MSLDVAVFSGRKLRLADGWWKQTLVTVFGGADVDGSAEPGEGARLTIVTVLGGGRGVVPAGARRLRLPRRPEDRRSLEAGRSEDSPACLRGARRNRRQRGSASLGRHLGRHVARLGGPRRLGAGGRGGQQ